MWCRVSFPLHSGSIGDKELLHLPSSGWGLLTIPPRKQGQVLTSHLKDVESVRCKEVQWLFPKVTVSERQSWAISQATCLQPPPSTPTRARRASPLHGTQLQTHRFISIPAAEQTRVAFPSSYCRSHRSQGSDFLRPPALINLHSWNTISIKKIKF